MSDLFSPPRTNEKVQRGVLVESSPPRPSLVIPAGLTRLESPNKPMNTPVNSKDTVSKDAFEFLSDFGLDEEGGGRRTSRARKQINYALPNLRDKMRREDNPEEKGRNVRVDRSITPDQGLV
jgi:Shugoshin C terminus